MGNPLSNDLRARLIRAVEGGMAARAAGRKLDISASAATAIVKRWRDTGSYEPGQMGGHKRAVLEDESAFVEKMVTTHCDWSEEEMCAHIQEELGIHLHPTNVGRFVRKKGWRFKKNSFRQRTGS